MNRLFTPFCMVNYAFKTATMNPQNIRSMAQTIRIVVGFIVSELIAIGCTNYATFSQ